MKSALVAAIFGITGGVAILLAVPAEEKAPVIKIQLPKPSPDYGDLEVPQIEEVPPQEVLVPEPLDHYLVAQAKTEKICAAASHACRPPPAKLLREISCRFHQTPKTSGAEIIL